jgi:hypothetical protein
MDYSGDNKTIAVVSNNQIRDNSRRGIWICGLVWYSTNNITVSNNTIIGNSEVGIAPGALPDASCGGSGGDNGATVDVTNNYIADNLGGGIYASSTHIVNVRYNRIHNNTATNGSALYIRSSLVNFEYNTITGGTGTSLIFKYQGNPTIRNNNFIHKSETYLVYDDRHVGENATSDFENNWLGTTMQPKS